MTAFKIHKLDATTSTNEVLKKRISKNEASVPRVVCAEYQTEGRGQFANRWESQKGKNLTFSVFWPELPFGVLDHFQVNKGVCLALVRVLRSYEIPAIKIKWPNDILSGNSKVAGILIENYLQGKELKSTIVGIGMNVNQSDFSSYSQASSLSLLLGKELDRNVLFEKLLQEIEAFFLSLNNQVVEKIQKIYIENLYGYEQWYMFEYKNKKRKGKIIGVNPSGALQLEWQSGEIEIFNNSKLLKLIH